MYGAHACVNVCIAYERNRECLDVAVQVAPRNVGNSGHPAVNCLLWYLRRFTAESFVAQAMPTSKQL
jgi:hypothetical protein